jgi:UDP-N-acetylmuramoyl-L-alanyl-D-glutamate--2,6-diaminopimelate ligase
MAGRFNVSNALAATAVALTLGVSSAQVADALATFPGVPGRMEQIDLGQPFDVIVDYAHTTDSLEKVLRVLRPVTEGQLVAVFGCAGERDATKRAPMGRVAGEMADFVIITNEDPRLEDEDAILADIERGLRDAGRTRGADYLVIADRQRAVEAALQRAVEGDTIVLAGKGHEQCIIVGETKVPWDDREAARGVLRGLGYGGPAVVRGRGGA